MGKEGRYKRNGQVNLTLVAAESPQVLAWKSTETLNTTFVGSILPSPANKHILSKPSKISLDVPLYQ